MKRDLLSQCFFNRIKLGVILVALGGTLPIFAQVIPDSELTPSYFMDHSVKDLSLPSMECSDEVFHLFAHGRAGQLLINGQWLNAAAIATWLQESNQLQHKTQLNIYACNFAKGKKGLTAFAFLTKALDISIAASDDLTGKDGDWDLEVGESFAALQFNDYEGNLQSCGGVVGGLLDGDDFDADGYCNGVDLDDDNDGIVDTKEMNCGTFTLDLSGVTNATPNIVDRAINPLVEFDGTLNVNSTSTDGARPFGKASGDLCMGVIPDLTPAEWVEYTIDFDYPVDVRLEQSNGCGWFDNAEKWDISSPTGIFNVDAPVITHALVVGSPASELSQVTGDGTSAVSFVPNVSGGHIPTADSEWSIEGLGIMSLTLRFAQSSIFSGNTYQRGVLRISITCVSEDSDGDGLANHVDLDADNDGLPDIIEAGGVDTDGDGHIDYPTMNDPTSIVDLDGDGLADTYDETDNQGSTSGWVAGRDIPLRDSDGDGLVDVLDLDADNDGLPDIIEAGGVDFNGDGLVDTTTDADNDGFSDVYDPDNDGTIGIDTDAEDEPLVETDVNANPLNGETGESLDKDGDGYPDNIDLDADNDGIPDLVEAGGIDDNGDGLVDNPTDTDNDGFADVFDADNNGTPGIDVPTAALVQTGGTDDDGDGKADDVNITFVSGEGTNVDKDKDGNPDHLDLDADNDGIPDLVEAGGIDTDGDGQVDAGMATDADLDGYADIFDTDDDGTAGIDNLEDALMKTDGADDDGDGKADDVNITYVDGDDNLTDSDGDGLPDHLDLDADNDGVPDLIEAGGVNTTGNGQVDVAFAPWDSDGDGLADLYDSDNNKVAGTGDGGLALIQTNGDTDSDGKANTGVEAMISGGGGSLPINPDNDGVANHLDIDADNDGIMDVTETGATDSNNDGRVDDGAGAFVDTDNDGFADGVDGNVGNDGVLESSNPLITSSMDVVGDVNTRLEYTGNGISDTDGDDVPNFLDVDADNDGIYDNYEAQATAGYIPTGTMDTDGDGLLDAYDVNSGASSNGLTPYNHDASFTNSDLVPDYLDTDSDNDGIFDRQETWDNLADGDSKEDNLSVACTTGDVDGDGLLACYDSDDTDPTVISWTGNPADDNASTDANAGSTGTVFGAGSSLDNLLPDNGGLVSTEPDFRDLLIEDCDVPEVYYAISEQDVNTVSNYEYNSAMLKHEDGASTGVVRATAFCNPNGDYYYFFNPLEPDNYLFAIRNSIGSPNTVPMEDLVDYIEIKLETNPSNRWSIGATEATLALERDWNVVFKGTPTSGSSFDVKFYFQPEELARLDSIANEVVADANSPIRDAMVWFKKPGGLSNSDITNSGVTDMEDISSFDTLGVNETVTGHTDGTEGVDAGNGKNFVSFIGLTSFSGGTGAIHIAYSSLPVELSYFNGKAAGCSVQLDWEAKSEENFRAYVVERGYDGERFEALSTIATSTNREKKYKFMDENPRSTNYYRLKMIDLDGSFEYSEMVSVGRPCEAEIPALEVYPNPVGNNGNLLNIRFFAEDLEAEMVITDLLGRPVRIVSTDTDRGWNSLQLDITGIPMGTYLIGVKSPSSNMSTTKVVVTK